MSLWGKTDTAASAPKFLSTDANAAPQVKRANAYFVDLTEAAVASNRAVGLHTPGWNLFTSYTDSTGNTRRRVECLVPVRATAVAAGDVGITNNTSTEDLVVKDS